MSSFTSSFSRYTMIVLVVLVLSGISSLTATEVLIRTRVIPKDSFNWHLHRFLTGRNENVVFGDSHTAYGIHGLSDFFNLSYFGSNVANIEVMVRSYFADKRPGKIILQADAHMFAPERQTDSPEHARLFATKTGRVRLWTFTDVHRNNIIKYWELVFQGGFENKYTFQPDGAITHPAGNHTLGNLSEEERLAEVDDLVNSGGFRPVEAPEASRNAHSYARILQFLTSRGAEVCMVEMPLSQSLRSSMTNFGEFQRTQLFLESLAARYGARFVDASAEITNAALFADSSHLNEDGARELAPWLEAACFGDALAIR